MRLARAGKEARRLATDRFVDDDGEQRAPDPFSAMGPRDGRTAALRAVRVLERASCAYICERSKVPRSVVDRDPQPRLIRRHRFPRPPFLRAPLLHRAVPRVPLGDPRFAIAILEWPRAVTRGKARGQALGVGGDHPRDDRPTRFGVKSCLIRVRFMVDTDRSKMGEAWHRICPFL